VAAGIDRRLRGFIPFPEQIPYNDGMFFTLQTPQPDSARSDVPKPELKKPFNECAWQYLVDTVRHGIMVRERERGR